MIIVKVLILQHRLPPSIGGTESHVWLLAKELSRRGINITIFSSNSLNNKDIPSLQLKPPFIRPSIKSESSKLPLEEIKDGVLIKRFPVLFRIFSFNLIPSMFREFSKNIKKYDIVHGHVYNLFTNVIGCFYAKKYGIPFILTAHDLVISKSHFLDAKLLKKLYDLIFGSYLVKNSTRLIALTDAQIKEYISHGGKDSKIEIVPNAIDLRNYGKNRINPDFLKNYRIETNEKILLVVGRIERYKHIQDIIEIIPELLKKFKNLKLLIVGEDYGYRKYLEQQTIELKLEKNVNFLGRIAFDDLMKMYQLADVFVFPSTQEGFGIVLLEAMASGTICVARSIPATQRVIQNGETGFLVDDKKEFLEKIVYLFENKEKSIKIQNNALDYVQQYSENRIVDKIEKLYLDVLSENQKNDM